VLDIPDCDLHYLHQPAIRQLAAQRRTCLDPLAGKPREWFNTQEEQQYRARWRVNNSTDLSCKAYLDLARVESTTSNGISGIKLHYYEFVELPKKMEAIENLRGLTHAQLMARLFH
jgi:hypothetical protein